jgi:hypothetical protein
MESPPLPAYDLVEAAAAVVAVFGQFNLYDADLRALQFTTDAERGAALDLEFELPGEFASGVAAAARAPAYRISLRCADVADLSALEGVPALGRGRC